MSPGWLALALVAAVQGAIIDANVMRREDIDPKSGRVHKEKPERHHAKSERSVEVPASGDVVEHHADAAHAAHGAHGAHAHKAHKAHKAQKEHKHHKEHSHKELAEMLEQESHLPEGVLDASLLEVSAQASQASQASQAASLREVMFGVYCRRVFDVDVLQKTWTGDIVITTSWNDPLAAEVIPTNKEEKRFATDVARKLMWLPDISVTNRDFKNLEVISSSVKVWSSGWATKVERMLVTMTNDFDTKAYPYDQQTLQVILASEKLMADELVLKPHTDKTLLGVKDDVLTGTGFIGLDGTAKPGYNISSFQEADALLVKSRGLFEIHILRSPASAGRQLFGPTFILLSVSYSVFFFPMVPAFAMPRVASGIISLLGMVTFMTKNKMPDSWTDVYLESICLQIACVCILSLSMEIVFHTCKNEDFAKQLNFEYKVAFPVASFLIFFLLLAFSAGGFNDVCCYLVRTLIFLLMVGNFVRIYRRTRPAQAEKGAEGAPAEPAEPAEPAK
ncbi:unnamed protein product [Effrenium voratum]|nr:unnamed protein product [Effrenium voratum]